MAEENKFRGFEAIADNLIKPTGGTVPLDNDEIEFTDPDEIIKKEEESTEEEEEVVIKKPVKKDEETEEEEEETEEVVKEDEEETEPIDPAFEGDITKFFHQKLSEELGWDYDPETSFDTVAELVEYMETLVGTASKPVYSNEEVGKIDEFVRNGGKIEDYYKAVSTGTVDVDNIDLTKESNQRLVIEENLRRLGYNEERIQRSVDRYEDKGVLEEESEEALELLKEYKEKNKEKLLEDTKKETVQLQQQQQKFISNVEETIDKLTDIAGYPLTSREKKELKDYIFKPNKDGRTSYQVEYSANQEKNLIESAFFTKNKDVILEKAKKQASTDTLKDMQRKLKTSRGKGSTQQTQDSGKGSLQALSNLGRLLSKQ